MKIVINFAFGCVLLLCALVLYSCSSDTTEYDQMSVTELRVLAMKYKKTLSAQSRTFSEIIERALPEKLPTEPFTANDAALVSKALEDELGDSFILERYIADLATFELLRQKIKQKGGDLSGLEIDDVYRIREDRYRRHILPPLRRKELPPELREREST